MKSRKRIKGMGFFLFLLTAGCGSLLLVSGCSGNMAMEDAVSQDMVFEAALSLSENMGEDIEEAQVQSTTGEMAVDLKEGMEFFEEMLSSGLRDIRHERWLWEYSRNQELVFCLLEGEWVVTEYAGTLFDHLPAEAYTEEYWEDRENYINTTIGDNLGREFRIEQDTVISIFGMMEAGFLIEDDAMLSFVTPFFHPEISIEAPYIGASIHIQDDDDIHNTIIDSNGTVLIEIGNCYFRMERKAS